MSGDVLGSTMQSLGASGQSTYSITQRISETEQSEWTERDLTQPREHIKNTRPQKITAPSVRVYRDTRKACTKYLRAR